MEILTATHTDIGIQKETNQDSLCLKVAETTVGKVVLAVICDGMGGLAKGEVASTSVIRAFSKWFEEELPEQLANRNWDDIEYRWERIIKEQNQRIATYGRKVKINLGTTLTAMLLIDSEYMLIGHVGDSRAYRLDTDIYQLTEDQTVVAQAVRQGKLTTEQARKDPRKNVLLQCIGASRLVQPEFVRGKAGSGEVYLLCSDGFRHEVTDEEIFQAFDPGKLQDEATMEKRAVEMVELVKEREETDNISVLVVKIQ